ncbi:MAG TPA: hypothetical protein VFU32_02175 [Ktedonobacterales bacterium]|nr:hypothetical protein [Ktedonobacterales bacterium]
MSALNVYLARPARAALILFALLALLLLAFAFQFAMRAAPAATPAHVSASYHHLSDVVDPPPGH